MGKNKREGRGGKRKGGEGKAEQERGEEGKGLSHI